MLQLRRAFDRFELVPLLGACVWLTAALPASAAITFDFDLLPDSAGCATAVPAGGDDSSCNPAWVSEWSSGTLESHTDTEQGLTLTLGTTHLARSAPPHIQASYLDWGFVGGQLQCGNAFDCFPYLADFSTGLSDAQVEFLGVEAEGDPVEPLLYYLEAYSGVGGSGALLASATQGPSPSALLAVVAPLGEQIRSLIFGVASGCIGTECDSLLQDNTGVIGQLVVSVPEPGSAALVATGLLVLATRSRARSRR